MKTSIYCTVILNLIQDLRRLLLSLLNNLCGRFPAGRPFKYGMTGLLTRVRAFTLMELMVAVIIIAVLAAVAVPQYKKAVLKSRFSTLMPIGKSLAQGNEVYYLGTGEYTTQKAKLDIEGQASYPEGVTIELATDPEYLSYVRVANPDKVPTARYVVYQKHSKNFADTTMCEANDDAAKDLCQRLGGVFVSENGTDSGWTAYMLSGELGVGDAFDSGTSGEGNGQNEGEENAPKQCPTGEGTREITCDCGGPITQTGTCNTETGLWEYSGSTCPVKPNDKTYTCPSDQSTFTVSYQCNNGTFSAYQSEGSCKMALCVARYVSSNLIPCNGVEITSHCSPAGSGTCSDVIVSGEGAYCEANNGTGGCSDGMYIGKNSYCRANISKACQGGIYSGEGAYCESNGKYSCNNAIFKAGTYCKAITTTGTCKGTYEKGSYCTGSYCPAGSPASADGKTCWNGKGKTAAKYCK